MTVDARFSALAERYRRLLQAAITRSCPPGIDTADIEQEALLRLWRALRSERGVDRPASFVYRAAVSATVDAIRRARARREEPLEAAGEHDGAAARAPSHEDPELRARRAVVMERVMDCFDTLEADRRRAVGLHLQGFTTREIGELLGWTEPRARNLVYRGLAQLRRRLRAEGITNDVD